MSDREYIHLLDKKKKCKDTGRHEGLPAQFRPIQNVPVLKFDFVQTNHNPSVQFVSKHFSNFFFTENKIFFFKKSGLQARKINYFQWKR